MLAEDEAVPLGPAGPRETDYAAWLTIQIGCDNSCAFCIVPSVRGAEISRPFDDIVAEARAPGRRRASPRSPSSARTSTPTAVIWPWPPGGPATTRSALRPQFASLLRRVGAVDGIRRVRYTSPHPKDMTPDVFEAMAETPAVVNHLHFPLQSGSDRILSAMHRGYTGARYLEKLAQARDTIDDLAVTTDIIVGFPGETEDDFAATLELAAEARFDSAYTFVFSPRPGTEAAEMVDDFCDPEEVKDRYARLRTVIERSALDRYRARVGLVEEVVIEGRSKKDPEQLTGRTAHNKLVHVPVAPELGPLRPGTYATARITDAAHQYLLGELIDVVARPTHRTRIPVVSA